MITIHIDGASRNNPGDAGVGIIAKDGEKVLFEIAEYIGKETNNVAEYTALIMGLKKAISKKILSADFFSDSQLIVEQIKGNYRVKDETLQTLFHEAKGLISKMKHFSISHVRREFNKEADMLANNGIDSAI